MRNIKCNQCGIEFSTEYGMNGLIHHDNHTNSFNMAVFVSRFSGAKTDEERLAKMLDHLDAKYTADYNITMQIFDCMIYALRHDGIDNREAETDDSLPWYTSYPDVADFMEKHKDFVRIAHNKHITKELNKVKAESESKLKQLKKQII